MSNKSFMNFGLVKRDPNTPAPESGNLFVVMVVNKWTAFKDNAGEPLHVKVNSIGFLPVYHDRSIAERDYPGSEIVTVDKTGLWESEDDDER